MTLLKDGYIIPTLEELKDLDLSYMTTISKESGVVPQVVIENELNEPPGVVPYPLYAYFSTLFDNKVILDVGTLHGGSALAAAYNPTNHVISYEVIPHIEYDKIKKDNVTFKLMDFRQDDTLNFDEVEMIIIDTNHTGAQEREFMKFLSEKKWVCTLLLDDIHKNSAMRGFWCNVDDGIKMYLTGIGHTASCGTGYVEFDLENMTYAWT